VQYQEFSYSLPSQLYVLERDISLLVTDPPNASLILSVHRFERPRWQVDKGKFLCVMLLEGSVSITRAPMGPVDSKRAEGS
jgi:hypothetical protein